MPVRRTTKSAIRIRQGTTVQEMRAEGRSRRTGGRRVVVDRVRRSLVAESTVVAVVVLKNIVICTIPECLWPAFRGHGCRHLRIPTCVLLFFKSLKSSYRGQAHDLISAEWKTVLIDVPPTRRDFFLPELFSYCKCGRRLLLGMNRFRRRTRRHDIVDGSGSGSQHPQSNA